MQGNLFTDPEKKPDPQQQKLPGELPAPSKKYWYNEAEGQRLKPVNWGACKCEACKQKNKTAPATVTGIRYESEI